MSAKWQIFVGRKNWEQAVLTAKLKASTDLKLVKLDGGGVITNGVVFAAGLPQVFRLTPTPVHQLTFKYPILAMGGDWDLSPGGTTGGLLIEVQSYYGGIQTIGYILSPLNPSTNVLAPYVGFWGFTTSVPIAHVRYWSIDWTGNSEDFELSKLEFCPT